jgi:glycosyltransferase involved in cell wall biosynthesis
MSEPGTLPDISVIVPARNAANLLEDCLDSIRRNGVRELIVVDGESTDGTREIAERFGAIVLSDEGRGLPVARYLGASAATSSRVALIDADVVLPDGSLGALLDEFESESYAALQAGQHSVSGDGYWGQALAYHHRTGRSRKWFGLVATIFDRRLLLEHGFDERFVSGEDIEMRWRLTQIGAKIGVSERTVVTHRFADDSFEFARGQFRADGKGLGRMVRKHGLGGLRLVLLPAAAAARGIVLCTVRLQPKWIPYFVTYAIMNYVAMASVLTERTSG